MKQAGRVLLALVLLVAAAAPWLAPNPPDRAFPDLLYAPPTPIRFAPAPSIYPQRLVSRLERRFEEDREHPAAVQWLTGGRIATLPEAEGGPLLLLGADRFGRDTFSRLLYGARATLALAAV